MKLISKEVEEVVRAEVHTVTGVRCDICGKDLRYKYRPNSDFLEERPKYFDVTTGHHDWGNDSCDSIEHKDICLDCIVDFVSDYLSNASGTEYIEIETHYCYPEKVDLDSRSWYDRHVYHIDEGETDGI